MTTKLKKKSVNTTEIRAGSHFYPAMHISASWIESLFTGPHPGLKARMDKLRQALADAVDYPWGNSHFYITNARGIPIMHCHFEDDGITCWIEENGVNIGEFNFLLVSKVEWNHVVDQVTKGLTPCGSCGKWIPHAEVQHYSFAGGVCPKCYNPAKHLPPDTRGD